MHALPTGGPQGRDVGVLSGGGVPGHPREMTTPPVMPAGGQVHLGPHVARCQDETRTQTPLVHACRG